MSKFKFDVEEEVNNIVFNTTAKRGMHDKEEADIIADFEQFNAKREESGLDLLTFEEFLTFIGFNKGSKENTVDDFSDINDGVTDIVEECIAISDDDLNLDDLS